MFPRAPRFDEARALDVPGPNSYDPMEPQANYKRGAMYEKDARFKNGAAQHSLSSSPPRVSSPCVCSKRGASPSATRLVTLEKDKVKLEARLSKAEEECRDITQKLNAALTDKSSLQTELRLLTQKHEKLQDQQSTKAKRDAARASVSDSLLQELQDSKDALKAEQARNAQELAAASAQLEIVKEKHAAEMQEQQNARTAARDEHVRDMAEAQELLQAARLASKEQREKHAKELNDVREGMSQLKSAAELKADDLRKVVEEERARHRLELDRMSTQLIVAERERRDEVALRMEISKALTEAREAQEAVEKETQRLQVQLADLTMRLDTTSENHKNAESEIARLDAQLQDSCHVREAIQASLDEMSFAKEKISKELAELSEREDEHDSETSESLRKQCQALMKSAMQFAQAYRDEQAQHKITQRQARLAEIKRHQRASSILSQSSTSDSVQADFSGTCLYNNDELGCTTDPTLSRRRSIMSMSAVSSSSHPSSALLGYLDDVMTEAVETKDILKSTSNLLQSHDAIRQELAEERCGWLNERMDELHEHYIKALQSSGSHTDLLRKVDKLRGELATMEEAYEAGVMERIRAERTEEELKADLLETQIESASLTRRLQELESQASSMAQIHEREQAWAQERSSLLDELAHVAHYEAAYASLHTEAQTLLVKLSSRQIRPDEVARLGATLSSQANPHSNVLYMDRIRRQLDEMRLQCHMVEGERDQLRVRVQSLQSQLDLYAHIGAPAMASRQIVHHAQKGEAPPLRPQGKAVDAQESMSSREDGADGLGLSLDGMTEGERERLAAKLAWQQRPRNGRTNRTLREQRSTVRLRQDPVGGHSGETLLAQPLQQPLGQMNDDTHDSTTYSAVPSSAFTPSTAAVTSSQSSQADTASLLQSPASITGAGASQTVLRSNDGFFARLAKTVGGGQAYLANDKDSQHEHNHSRRQAGQAQSSSFGMPFDDGQFGFEDLAP